MEATTNHPRAHLARIAAVAALVIVTVLTALAVIQGRASDATASTPEFPGAHYISAEECPEATARFVELGLAPPETFTPGCPVNPRKLGRDLADGLNSSARLTVTAAG